MQSNKTLLQGQSVKHKPLAIMMIHYYKMHHARAPNKANGGIIFCGHSSSIIKIAVKLDDLFIKSFLVCNANVSIKRGISSQKC